MIILSNKNLMLEDVCYVRSTGVNVGENVNQKKMCCCK